MSGFVDDGSLGKVWSNIVVPGAYAAANQAYEISKPMFQKWARGKVQKGTKRIIDSVDSYFNASSPNIMKRQARSFESQGYSPAPEFSHWTQSSRATSATNLSRSVNGQSSSVSPSDGVCVPAMFNPGRGAELGLVNKLIDAPLKFKTGEHPGPSRPHDPQESIMQLYKPLRFNQAFAWKASVPKQSFTDGALVNRGYVHNVFRHYNYGVWGTGTSDYCDYASNKPGWNKSLGPDKSQTRKPPQVTNAAEAALLAAGFSGALESPYRNPANGEIMYSRITQQFLENMGWAANPFKYISPFPGSTGNLELFNPIEYKNAGTAYEEYPLSCPAQQPMPAQGNGSPYYYRSQMGQGRVSYDFSNDGSGPIVVDVVINKVKQGKAWDSVVVGGLTGNAALLDDCYKNGYLRMTEVNVNLTAAGGLSGQPALSSDCLTNARVQFMPKAALKYAVNLPTGQGSGQLDMPFKQVARDQFIISAGATRAWSFMLPALDYDPRRYSRSTSLSASIDRVNMSDICTDFTYIVSIAYSSVSVPLTENPTVSGVTSGAIIDRRPADCSISVTGSYEESCHPVYISKDTLSQVYINGALDVPFYQTTAPTTMRAIEIANLNQVTRDSTPGSAYVSVGALNTLSGA